MGTFEESRVAGRESRVAPSAVRPFGSAASSPASGRARLLCIPPPQERGLIQLRIAHEPPYRRALRARRYLPPCGGTDRRSLSAFPPAGGPIGLRDRTDTSALGSGYRQTVAPPLGGARLIRRIRREGGYPALPVGFAPLPPPALRFGAGTFHPAGGPIGDSRPATRYSRPAGNTLFNAEVESIVKRFTRLLTGWVVLGPSAVGSTKRPGARRESAPSPFGDSGISPAAAGGKKRHLPPPPPGPSGRAALVETEGPVCINRKWKVGSFCIDSSFQGDYTYSRLATRNPRP